MYQPDNAPLIQKHFRGFLHELDMSKNDGIDPRCKDLCNKTILQAYRDLINYDDSCSSITLQIEALNWFHENDVNNYFNCPNICELIGISYRKVLIKVWDYLATNEELVQEYQYRAFTEYYLEKALKIALKYYCFTNNKIKEVIQEWRSKTSGDDRWFKRQLNKRLNIIWNK